jgi:hypothetical protein
MKTPNTPDELLKIIEQSHQKDSCQCNSCKILREVEDSRLSVQEITEVSFTMLCMSLRRFEAGLKDAVQAKEYQDAVILGNLLGLLYSATSSLSLFRGALNDYKEIVDSEQ